MGQVMELVFIYIEEHKILEDFNASFSSKFTVNFSDFSLSIERKEDTTFDYYSGLNIKAIVGQNGTGKSTLLDFIEESCSSYSESSGFLIWYDSNNKMFLIHEMNNALKHVRISCCQEYKLVGSNKSFFTKTETKIFKINNMATAGFNGVKRKRKNIIDYSLGTQSKFKGKKRSMHLCRMLDFFNNSEWLKNKQARYSYTFEFKTPSTAIQKWIFSLVDDYNKSLSKTELGDIHRKHETKLFELSPLFPKGDYFNPESIFQGLLKRNIYSFIKAMPSMKIANSKIADKICLEIVNNYMLSDQINPVDIIEIVKNNHKEYAHEYKSGTFDLFDFNEVLELHFNKFFQSLDYVSHAIYNASSYQAAVYGNKLESHYHEAILDILNTLTELHPCITNNFQYGWEGFSTGELAKLNIFSSLYNIANEYLGENALVIIDEVDLFLHPEWQRTFVSELIAFIKETNFDVKLQIILTTHSPIIIGDFLPKDIISLHLNNQGIPTKAESFGFGTGITEAYVLGMHIKSTYGEHSRLKLMSIINNKLEGKLTGEDEILINQISNAELRESILK